MATASLCCRVSCRGSCVEIAPRVRLLLVFRNSANPCVRFALFVSPFARFLEQRKLLRALRSFLVLRRGPVCEVAPRACLLLGLLAVLEQHLRAESSCNDRVCANSVAAASLCCCVSRRGSCVEVAPRVRLLLARCTGATLECRDILQRPCTCELCDGSFTVLSLFGTWILCGSRSSCPPFSRLLEQRKLLRALRSFLVLRRGPACESAESPATIVLLNYLHDEGKNR